MLRAAFRHVLADWWLEKGNADRDFEDPELGDDSGGETEPCEAEGEGVGPPTREVQEQPIEGCDSPSPLLSHFDLRSQCLAVKTATSAKAQYLWHLILALLILMRAMQRSVRATTSSDGSTGDVVDDDRTQLSASLDRGSRKASSSRILW
jgi:hypothetical protein